MRKIILLSIIFVAGCYDSYDYYSNPAVQTLNNQKYSLENEAQNLLREDKRQRNENNMLIQKEAEIIKKYDEFLALLIEFKSTLTDEQKKNFKYWWFNETKVAFLDDKFSDEQIRTIQNLWFEESELRNQALDSKEKRQVLLKQHQETLQSAISLQNRYADYQRRQRLVNNILLAQEQDEQRFWQQQQRNLNYWNQQQQQQQYQQQMQESLRGIEIGIMNLRPNKVQILR